MKEANNKHHCMDTYADDLSELIETLDLKGTVLIGFSAGGGEVARYIGRHGTKRVARAARFERHLKPGSGHTFAKRHLW